MRAGLLQETGCVELSRDDLSSINGGEVPAWWLLLLIGSALANSGDIIDGLRDGYTAAH